MNRKEWFNKVIKEKGYDSVVDLMKKVESLVEGDVEKGVKKASTNKNYSNMIAGTNGKDFPTKYVVALEKVLGMRYIDMITPGSLIKPMFENDSLRSIAYSNDYDKTREFALKTVGEESAIYNSDEYGKHFLDYIIEYSSINCLRYIVEANDLTFDYSGYLSSPEHHFYCNDYKQIPFKVANLICEFDDADLFNRVFDPFKMISFSSGNYYVIYEDEEFAVGILKTNKILDSLLKPKLIDVDEVNDNHGTINIGKALFANMLINTVLKAAMKNPVKYEKQLKKILDKSYYINKDISKNLQQFDEPFQIDKKGFIKSSWIIYGQAVRFNRDLPILPETSKEIRDKLEDLEKPLIELEYKESVRYGRREYYVVDGKMHLNASNNDCQYDMMRYMNDKGFKKIPILYSHTDNVDIIEYKKPSDHPFACSITNEQIIDIAKFLKTFHELSKEKLGDDKVYLHNNLTYSNCSFNDKGLDCVIDWSKCSIGKPLEDILPVIINWSGMLSRNRFKEDVFEKIKLFIDNYKLDDEINLGDELMKYLNERLNHLDKNSESYEDNYEAIKYALIFVELQQNRLNERSFQNDKKKMH